MTDNSTPTSHTPQVVTYTATPKLTQTDENNQITLTDKFPSTLTPQQTGLGGGSGNSVWSCSIAGQTVTCTLPSATIGNGIPAVNLPAAINVQGGSQQVTNSVTIAGYDSAASAPDTETYSGPPTPTATALTVTGQPQDTKVNTVMTNPNGSTTQITVAATVGAGGSIDQTYTGPVTLGFANNPGNAKFVTGSTTSPTLMANAVNGVATFSPITINAVGLGDTLVATSGNLTPATTTSFDVAANSVDCAATQTCTVTVTSNPAQGESATVTGTANTGGAVITASFGGNVAPIHPCTTAAAGVLTFNGNASKTVNLTLSPTPLDLIFCYGQTSPFTDITLHKTTFRNPLNNNEYEGVLGPCLGKLIPPPCISGLSYNFFTRTEKVTVIAAPGDPKLTH